VKRTAERQECVSNIRLAIPGAQCSAKRLSRQTVGALRRMTPQPKCLPGTPPSVALAAHSARACHTQAAGAPSQYEANASGAVNVRLTRGRYDPAGAQGLARTPCPVAPATPWGRHAPGRGLTGTGSIQRGEPGRGTRTRLLQGDERIQRRLGAQRLPCRPRDGGGVHVKRPSDGAAALAGG
jgi:hypothetical protein